MKRCTGCEHQSDDDFTFCPIDGMPLTMSRSASFFAQPANEYRVTIVDGAGLLSRLCREVWFVGSQVTAAWPEVKRNPAGFVTWWIVDSAYTLLKVFGRDVLVAATSALLIVLSAVTMIVLLDKNRPISREPGDGDTYLTVAEIIPLNLPDQNSSLSDLGIGAGSQGRVGFATGKGEGSDSEPKKSGGGGSGGLQDPLPAQRGRTPQPSEIPAPISAHLNPALPLAGIDLDPALWRELPLPNYGDPRSRATALSNGPGTGGGIGSGNGQGVGHNGNGPGYGPGEAGNMGGGPKEIGGNGPGGSSGDGTDDPWRVFRSDQVNQRARITSKPEPQYTEAARRNQVTGTVVLNVVFSRSGEVTNIRVIQSLPDGITEKAIAAARAIRFLPALKNNYPVSVYMQLEYNFNLY